MTSQVFNMDCIIGMAEYPDKYFDLAVVDPPYGINVNHNMGRRKGDRHSGHKPAVWDNCSPPVEYFNEIFRISKDQVIWGANHFMSKIQKDSSCWLMWDKKFSEDLSFAQYEMAWTSFDSVCKKFDKDPKELGRIHPTQKPVALYSWIYHNYLPQGGKVIDTHLGSGSNRIAAHKAGNIDFVGYELDKDYFEAQEKRYKQFISQQVIQFA